MSHSTTTGGIFSSSFLNVSDCNVLSSWLCLSRTGVFAATHPVHMGFWRGKNRPKAILSWPRSARGMESALKHLLSLLTLCYRLMTASVFIKEQMKEKHLWAIIKGLEILSKDLHLSWIPNNSFKKENQTNWQIWVIVKKQPWNVFRYKMGSELMTDIWNKKKYVGVFFLKSVFEVEPFSIIRWKGDYIGFTRL